VSLWNQALRVAGESWLLIGSFIHNVIIVIHCFLATYYSLSLLR